MIPAGSPAKRLPTDASTGNRTGDNNGRQQLTIQLTVLTNKTYYINRLDLPYENPLKFISTVTPTAQYLIQRF